MKEIKNQNLNDLKNPIDINNAKTSEYTLSYKELLLQNNQLNKNIIKSKAKRIPTMFASSQERIKRKIIKEFGIQETIEIKKFNYFDFASNNSCTAFYFGEEPVEQKAYICTVCDNKKKYYMCNYCYKLCHQKCRKNRQKSSIKEYFNFQKFSCYCSTSLKHIIEAKKRKEIIPCTMMELDNILGIFPYHCYQHNVTVCCICAVSCHKECTVNIENNINEAISCKCKSDHHSNFNELALTFPLEQYKKVSNIDVWPVQILNILFYKGKTFDKMSQFFNTSLSSKINFNSKKNKAIINKFQNLLELFSDTFNRKFKTYYYAQQMIKTFEYDKVLSLVQILEVNNEQACIIKFRLLFILLFIHLRKDFRTIKSLTSTDFMCNNFLQRLTYKKLLMTKSTFTKDIHEKYGITSTFPFKEFILNEIFNLMIKGIELISIEENQDEFEIGFKIICFMLKRFLFTRKELIKLIDNMIIFHSKFYEYIMKEKNNIYLLIDIFNVIVELCFILAVNYNDLIIEEYLENFHERNASIGKFIHVNSEHSNKLFSIILKNCDLITKHYKILIKPSLDKKSKDEQKRELKIQKHLLEIQARILSQTTGVTTKMPDNGGLFTDKIINLNNETLVLFSLADNSYQKQLDSITDEEFEDYFSFCKKIENQTYQDIMILEEKGNNVSNNILYNLKLGLEEGYYSLFTTSYKKEERELNEKLKNQILIACDNIKKNIDKKCENSYYSKLISELEENDDYNNLNDIKNIEKIRRKILKDISDNIQFSNSPFLLIEEGRELLVDNLIISQVDESIFKGFFFLSNNHFPNIINSDLVKVFFDFLYLFLLTKRGVMYILTGKNIQVIQKLINRFRFDDNNKHVNIYKKRTEDFNVKSIKIVIHFLCILSKFVRKLNIKTLNKHKSIFKFKKSILNHLKNFPKHITTNQSKLEYKIQLKEGLEIFNNLYESFNYDQYEEIKRDIIEIFKNNFLNPKLFENLFDKSKKNIIPNFMEIRKYDLDYYFQFFEILTKNTFYVYENDEEGKKNIDILINFIDLENLSFLLNNAPELITFSQKTILLKFIRTFYLLDYLDQVNYIKKYHLLKTKQYKLMLKYNLVNNYNKNDKIKSKINYINNNMNNNKYLKYNYINNNYINNSNKEYFNFNLNNNNININFINNKNILCEKNNKLNLNSLGTNNYNEYIIKNNIFIDKNKYIHKLKEIEQLIILINLYVNEIESFPNSIKEENNNNHIKKYIKEIIFSVQEISTTIKYSKNIANILLPYYYKLVAQLVKKKDIFIKILNDIKENKLLIDPKNYKELNNIIGENEEYNFFVKRDFNIFDKDEIFRYAIKCIYEIYKKTKINEEYCLRKYLEMYDIYNEANFPPFSLLEVYDYEYFYDGQNVTKENTSNDLLNENKDFGVNILYSIKEFYIEQYKSISNTSFLSILSGEATDKKIDFGEKFVNLFQAFINSIQSDNFTDYRTLLCIMTKLLFYDGVHIQSLFNGMAYDKYFFNNLNRELNYYIVQCIDLSQKYELCSRCAEITNITKLTIQFLQLLGEGFNIKFHENILKGITKEHTKKKVKAESNKNFTLIYDGYENEGESSDNSEFEASKSNSFIGSNKDLTKRKKNNTKKEISLIYPKFTIFETAILNLKIIYHLMELNNLLEGESPFDKLCILSTNLIDFIIEYIDTTDNLTYIIDNNFEKLFFGNKYNKSQATNINLEQKGILPLFTMKIKEKYEGNYQKYINKYRLRKTMIAYIKIKYFQLLKVYLQLGNKYNFVQLLLSEHLGPFELYEEILYYMKELINNLVYKDYKKYRHLLNVDNINSYKHKLNELYKFEDDFRTSIEISVIFQICMILAILENTYKIKKLADNFNKSQMEEKSEEIIFNENNIDKDNLNIDINGNKKELDLHENDKDFFTDYEDEDKDDNTIVERNFFWNKKKKKCEDNDYVKESNIKFISSIIDNDILVKLKDFGNVKKDPHYKIKQNYNKKIREKKKLNVLNKEKKILEDENLNLNSIFSKAVYKFLDSLVSKVEIRINNEDNPKEEEINYDLVSNEISKKIINYKNDDIILSNINYDDIYGYNLDNNVDYELNNEENSENSIDDKEENSEEGKKYIFFIKPYLSFHLSEQTKTYFLNNVNRDSATSKYKELISYADYFMFEMMYNIKYMNNNYKFLNIFSKISFYALQLLNYLLILAENALLIYHYYKDYSLDYDEYYLEDESSRYKRFIDIIIIIIVKLILIFFALFVWFKSKFVITYQRNAIIKEDINFIFRQLGKPIQNLIHPTMVKYFREEGNLIETMSLINRDISFFKKIKLALLDSVLLNIDIDIFLFSLILDILFLIFGHPILLSIETLFIYGLLPELTNIFKSFIAKTSTFVSCLAFSYLIIYVFNYIPIFYIGKDFDFGDILEYKSTTFIKEQYCHSSIQCFLVLISYGTRAGGGIGDALPIISFKKSTNMFIARFFYDMAFFILIIMIMGNVTFGLIVDTFGALRDETYRYENDKNNICFICQISRDGCLLRHIDYEYHIKKNHNLWSYIDFLCYLHLYNANDFSRVENIVWEKLLKKDYDWLPINTDEGNDNDDDEEDDDGD